MLILLLIDNRNNQQPQLIDIFLKNIKKCTTSLIRLLITLKTQRNTAIYIRHILEMIEMIHMGSSVNK